MYYDSNNARARASVGRSYLNGKTIWESLDNYSHVIEAREPGEEEI